ncbi:MAG: acyl carrier protein [Clostridiales bacterium]|nr:acyl carrier protein [Clostridiales bacterium]
MREKILSLLKSNYPEIDFESSDNLVDDGILDSMTMVGIISDLSMEFGIFLPYEEIIPENFNSVDAMAALIQKYV